MSLRGGSGLVGELHCSGVTNFAVVGEKKSDYVTDIYLDRTKVL